MIDNTPKAVDAKMDGLRGGCDHRSLICSKRCNKYIDETMPWALAKDEKKDRLETVLWNLIQESQQERAFLNPSCRLQAKDSDWISSRRACDGETGDSFQRLDLEEVMKK